MKQKINSILPNHTLAEYNSDNFYVVDYKNINRGDVELHEEEPADVKSVHLTNKNRITICFDGFKENALPRENPGDHNRQCECILFPNEEDDTNWILCIETKYTDSIQNAFRKENNYPNCMIDQIVATVTYFRENGIIPNDKKVNAIVSFPPLIDDFSAHFSRDRIEEILTTKRINIRPTNKGRIISKKRIALG